MRLAAAVLAIAAAACASVPDAASPPDNETRVLRFESPAALEDWIAHDGEWRVRGGWLHGHEIPGHTPPAWLTYRTFYGSIDRVVIHGGLDERSPHNFRIGVGAASFLLNWELADQNHVHYGRTDVAGRHALVPGREHEIVVEQSGGKIRLVVDDRLLWEQEGTLAGTVTLYPAVGSTIRVRDVTITGRPVPWVEVTRPLRPHM